MNNDIRTGYEQAARALAERAAGHKAANNHELADECLQCVSMLHDIKPAALTSAPKQALSVEQILDIMDAEIQRGGSANRMVIGTVRAALAAQPVNAQLVEALKKAREDINWMINSQQFLNRFVFEYVDTALAAASDRIAKLEALAQQQDSMLGKRPCQNNRCNELSAARALLREAADALESETHDTRSKGATDVMLRIRSYLDACEVTGA